MNKQNPEEESQGLDGNFLRHIPFSVRTIILVTLVGLSMISYSIGRRIEANEQNISNSSISANQDIRVRRTGSAIEFSSDQGKTWSEKTPTELYSNTEDLSFLPSAKNMTKAVDSDTTFSAPFEGVDGSNFIMKQEDGKWQFSTDNGKTWSEKTPEGIEVDKDGTLTWHSESGEYVSEFNGKDKNWTYSTDGGKTWSNPLKDIEDWIADGFPISDEDGISVKFEDGKVLYSSDGGKTWSEEQPEGFEGTLHSVITKTEDGKTLYSTNGGKTWSEDKPEEFDISSIKDLLNDIPGIEDIWTDIPDDILSSTDDNLGSSKSTSL